jgi:hypothetical protein
MNHFGIIENLVVLVPIKTRLWRGKKGCDKSKLYFLFFQDLERIKAVVENGPHVSEDDTLNFRTIPDPFGSFIWNIPTGRGPRSGFFLLPPGSSKEIRTSGYYYLSHLGVRCIFTSDFTVGTVFNYCYPNMTLSRCLYNYFYVIPKLLINQKYSYS